MIAAASACPAPVSSYRRLAPRRTREIVPRQEALLMGAWEGEIAGRVLDRLELEVVVLDTKGAILFCSEAGRRLLAANAGVFSHRGALHFTDCENNRWLQSRLSFVPQASNDRRTVFILNEDQSKHRIVSLDVLRDEPTEMASFVLTFSRLTNSLAEEGVHQLMHHFGLTRAEQRLTLFLSEGGSLLDAARTFGVSCHTVRNQLRSVFEKAGVKRQSELTRLMCSGVQIRTLA